MRIGELARQAGVTTDTLRLYEEAGLLRSTRRDNGYRDYAEDMVTRLFFIRTGQRLGFTLAEMAAVVSGIDTLPTQAERDARVAALLATQLARVDSQMASLQALRDDLAARLASGCPLSDRVAPARPAGPPSHPRAGR